MVTRPDSPVLCFQQGGELRASSKVEGMNHFEQGALHWQATLLPLLFGHVAYFALSAAGHGHESFVHQLQRASSKKPFAVSNTSAGNNEGCQSFRGAEEADTSWLTEAYPNKTGSHKHSCEL